MRIAVEIPLYWHLIEDKRYHYGSNQNIEALLALADRTGVRLVSSVSQFELAGNFDIRGNDIEQSVIDFGRAGARRAIDVGAQLGT